MGIKIEKNIEMPISTFGRNQKFPWDDMAPGDSFFIALVNGQSLRELSQNVNSAAYHAGKKRSWKFCTRKVDNGVRVWRLA